MRPDPGQPVPVSEPTEVPAGTIHPAAATRSVFSDSSVNPSLRLPEASAQLTIQRAGPEHFIVYGVNVSCPLEEVSGNRYGMPDMVLASLLKDPDLESSHRDIIAILQEWSQTHDEIMGWINELRAKFGADLRLVIWDDAGFNFPWEMLWLDEDEARSLPGGWLGGLVSVARWTTLHRDARDPHADDPTHCSGRVLAYVDEAMEDDYTTAFIDFTSQDRDEIGDLDRFLARTADPAERFALLYVAAHGKYSPKWEQLRLASRSIIDWRGKLGALKKNPGLVFLNACHTGESVADERLKDGLLRGFAQMFLLAGAQGVLATLGEVENDHAREVAGQVVAALAAAHGAEVSVVLRDLRAHAVEKMEELADDGADLRPFFDMFMYVYFGNPATTVRLIRDSAR